MFLESAENDSNIFTKNLHGELNKNHKENDRWEAQIITKIWEYSKIKQRVLHVVSMNWGTCEMLAGKYKDLSQLSITVGEDSWQLKLTVRSMCDSWIRDLDQLGKSFNISFKSNKLPDENCESKFYQNGLKKAHNFQKWKEHKCSLVITRANLTLNVLLDF